MIMQAKFWKNHSTLFLIMHRSQAPKCISKYPYNTRYGEKKKIEGNEKPVQVAFPIPIVIATPSTSHSFTEG